MTHRRAMPSLRDVADDRTVAAIGPGLIINLRGPVTYRRQRVPLCPVPSSLHLRYDAGRRMRRRLLSHFSTGSPPGQIPFLA